uniref:DUF569 domain-containing protein n=1 Tax=Chenopodium quinoa TaxID=63459 RepID=A0A803ML47_CHEQI
MEFFQRAKVFRLKTSNQSKYLIADQDEDTVKQTRDSSSTYTRWSFELVEGKTNVIRIRSCNSWKYLAASEEPFLLGMTGKRVAQRPWLGATVEWEPIKEGPYIKLRSHTGTFLRSNKGLPPWRNTITHDLPGHWTASENMILWIVDIVEIDHKSTNGDSKSFKGNAVPSRLSNAVDHKSFSSCSTLSIEDDGPSTNSASSLEHSISFSNLRSMLDGLDDKVYVVTERTTSDTGRVLKSEIHMAKQSLKELTDMDYHGILSLGLYKELEKAISKLSADNKTSRQETLQEQLKTMKNDHNLATQDLVDYATFDSKILEIKAEVDKDVAKACVLEATLDKWFSDEYVNPRANKEELLMELEETESSIKAVEVLRSRIAKKNERLEEMEAKEESWQARQLEAERKLERVEKEWHSARVSSINGAKSSIVSEYSVQSAFEDVQTLEVKRAKQTFEQLKNAEFCTILSLGQDKKLEKAVDVLIADAKSIGRGKIPSKLVNIQEQLKSMKNDHELASQILVEHSTFSTKRLEIRDELKKDAAKARELQDLEVNVNNTIVDARAKREELLKQLEETENAIKKVEKARSDSMVEVEELISRIEQKSEGLKEMESKEKSWRVRKNEAERLLERVEKDWGKVKNSFSDV